jgi:DNA-binding transcriptional MerR regulator
MLTVSKVAAKAGIGPDTIRFYEKEGLLPVPQRTPSGYRSYEHDIVDRLKFIKGAQRFGLRLREIKELLEVMDRGLCPCGHSQRLLVKRIAEVDEELHRLQALRADLAGMVGRYPEEDCLESSSTGWLCEAEFITRGGEHG